MRVNLYFSPGTVHASHEYEYEQESKATGRNEKPNGRRFSECRTFGHGRNYINRPA